MQRVIAHSCPRRALAVAVATLCVLGGCGSPGEERASDLVVLGAASLTDVLREIGAAFESERGWRVLTSFAGSQTLATQLREGVRADVIAVADPELLADLGARGLVDAPQSFATSRIVWVRRRADAPPAPVEIVRAGGSLVLARPEVPAGAYARRALDALGLREAAEARLVSEELDVRGVIAKLRLAGADLGMVYATDISPTDPELEVVELPSRARVVATYAAARVRESSRPGAAAAFVDFLETGTAREILRRAGFGTP